MVYESRVGDVFALGASSWRIDEITHDRVLVTPAPGQPGRMPFWHGDSLGRSYELGTRIGAFVRRLDQLSHLEATDLLQSEGLDDFAAGNLFAYLDEQRAADAIVPTDRTLVLERCRDELGDWQIVLLSPFGRQFTRPGRSRSPPACVKAAGWTCRSCTRRRRHRAAHPRHRRRFPGRTGSRSAAGGPGRDHRFGHIRSRRQCPLRGSIPGGCGAGAAAAAQGSRQARAAVATASTKRANCWLSPLSTRVSDRASRRCASVCRTSTTRPPCARC